MHTHFNFFQVAHHILILRLKYPIFLKENFQEIFINLQVRPFIIMTSM